MADSRLSTTTEYYTSTNKLSCTTSPNVLHQHTTWTATTILSIIATMEKKQRKKLKRGHALDTTTYKQQSLDHFLQPPSSSTSAPTSTTRILSASGTSSTLSAPSPPGTTSRRLSPPAPPATTSTLSAPLPAATTTGTTKNKQVARKSTSKPPPSRPRDEPHPGPSHLSSAPSTPATPATPTTDSEEDVTVRIKPAHPHPKIDYQMTMFRLCHECERGEENVINWCQNYGLLLKQRPCDYCHQPCTIEYRPGGDGLPRWTCSKIGHRRFHETIAKNSVFEGSKFGIEKLLMMFYMFSHGITEYHHLERETSSFRLPDLPPGVELTPEEQIALSREKAKCARTSSATITQWLTYCREICFVALDKLFEEEGQIGGPGVCVEIDEMKIGKRKLHSGRRVDGTWVLGMIEIMTGDEGFKRRGGRFRLEICPGNLRDEATLTTLIRKHVQPGTTLITDGWKGYSKISDFDDYEHYTVIHEHNYVDPKTGANTQTVESNWRAMRRRLNRGGIPKDSMALHLCEFLWRRDAYRNEIDPFVKFIKDAAFTYNPNRTINPQQQ